jgi:hypothetical protein
MKESAGVPRVMKHLQHPGMDEASPDPLPFAHPTTQSSREQQALLPEVSDSRAAGAGAFIGVEQGPQCILDLAIWIEDHPALRIVDQSDG